MAVCVVAELKLSCRPGRNSHSLTLSSERVQVLKWPSSCRDMCALITCKAARSCHVRSFLVKLGEEEEISSPSGRSWNHDTCCSPPMRNTLASIVAAAPGRNPQLPNTHKSHGCLELCQELLQFYFRSFHTCFSFSFSFLLLNPVFHQRQNSSPVVLLLRRCPLVFFSHTHRENKQASKQPPPTTPTTLLTPQQPPLTWVSPKFHTKLLKSHNKSHTLQKKPRLCTRACCN